MVPGGYLWLLNVPSPVSTNAQCSVHCTSYIVHCTNVFNAISHSSYPVVNSSIVGKTC